jgi:excisionase family DNA binding protein
MSCATMDRLMRPREAAEWLGISERTLWSLTHDGSLQAVRIGRSIRYDSADLAAFVQSRKTGLANE